VLAVPQTPHIEKDFTAGTIVRDIVIGMSDGLTVPFALAAGLSGAVASTSIVVTAGLAEVAAGCIAMGLGGYLAARSDAEHYAHERQEIFDIFRDYGVTVEQAMPIVDALQAKPNARGWTS
jgi:VIT1/CCC1 family predicted Fe2+/Mn2+ transporter